MHWVSGGEKRGVDIDRVFSRLSLVFMGLMFFTCFLMFLLVFQVVFNVFTDGFYWRFCCLPTGEAQ